MTHHPASDSLFQHPFQLKHLLSLLLFVIMVAVPAFASDDVLQTTDDPKSLVKQGEKLYRRGDLAGAEAFFKRALTARPNDSAIKLKLAFLYLKMRRFVEAYEIAFPVAKAEPKNSYAYAVVGATFLGAGRF